MAMIPGVISKVFPLAGSVFIVNSLGMFLRCIFVLMLGLAPVVQGQEAAEQPKAKEFSLKSVVAPAVANMAVPKMRPEVVGGKMAISSSSLVAQAHVKQGFSLVHAHWDFEAYRHFCAALNEDPDCLMAYCGIALALARPYSEYVDYRRAAVDRMLDLMEAKAPEGQPGRYPEVERKFATAVATLVSASPAAAGQMFKKLGEEFPNLLQARLLGIFLTRGGYDVLGNAMPAQEAALQQTRELLAAHPKNPVVLSFWLALNAEAPNHVVNIKKELLPYARTLTKQCPDIPSWHHMQGHFEWRAGNYLLAERAFTRASQLYSDWMKGERIGIDDCEGYVKAQSYLASTLYQRGHFTEAMKVAKSVRAIKADVKRPRSQGTHILLWDAYTLPARLYAARGAKGDLNLALQSLPKSEEIQPFAKDPKHPTLAGVVIDAFRMYLGCRKAILDKNMEAAQDLHKKKFRYYLSSLAKVATGARRSSDASYYYYMGSALSVYDMELSGLIAQYGPEDMVITGANWFRAARDKQVIPTLMMPPSVPFPMENRLGDYYLSQGKATEAYEAYGDGQKRYPNNMMSLLGMEKSLLKLGKKEEAKKIQEHIELVK